MQSTIYMRLICVQGFAVGVDDASYGVVGGAVKLFWAGATVY